MLILTAGFWLFVLPFYPARCIRCGLQRSQTGDRRFLPVGLALLVLLLVLFVIGRSKTNPHPAEISKVDATEASRYSDGSNMDSSDHQPVSTVAINAAQLLKEYDDGEKEANARYKGARLEVTGRLTQIFIPSEEESMRLAAAGHHAAAFLLINSLPVPPSNPGQALFTPGISAHSKDGSFFGYASEAERPLRSGDVVTVICDGTTYNRISELTGNPRSLFGDIEVSLNDCVLQSQKEKGNEGVEPDITPSSTGQEQAPAPIMRKPPAGEPDAIQEPK